MQTSETSCIHSRHTIKEKEQRVKTKRQNKDETEFKKRMNWKKLIDPKYNMKEWKARQNKNAVKNKWLNENEG